MAAHVPHSIAIPSAHVRTGNNSLIALVGRVADPAIAVLVLVVVHTLYGLPFGSRPETRPSPILTISSVSATPSEA